MADSPPLGLVALQTRLTYDLSCLQWPAARWTPPRQHLGCDVADVAIIGAGMAGLALAAALRIKGVVVVVYDEAKAGLEGPWATTARMETLRSPKQLAGPALGLASLTFRAWFEAQWGDAAWAVLDKIPRLLWMDYLRWYRHVLGPLLGWDVRNEHHVTDVLPRADGLVELRVVAHDQTQPQPQPQSQIQSHWARRVVLATGRAGLGGPSVPEFAQALPRSRWVHSVDEFDYASLQGQRVGVVGAGASAMDSAATALEQGAAAVHLLVRRADIPRINKGKGAGNPGFVHGFGQLPDGWKWRFRHYIHAQQVPPPRNSTLRVSQHKNAFFHLNCAVHSVVEGIDLSRSLTDGKTALQVHTTRGPIELDFLIFGTGFAVDWAQRPLLRHIAPHVRLWRHRYQPPVGQTNAELADSPDLGNAFEFQAREEAPSPGLDRIHCFCYPAALSLGVITGDIPAISEGATQLATSLAGLLYVEDVETHFARMQAFAEPEVLGDEWVDSPLPI